MARKKSRSKIATKVSHSSGFAKLKPYALAHSFGLVSALAIVFYAIMSWLGDFDASVIAAQYPIPFSFDGVSFIIGLLQTYVFGFIGAWIFVKIYNAI